MSEHVFYGVACNSADEVALAAEIPLSETERGVLSAAVIAEAVTGPDWLLKHDREVKAEAWNEGYSHLFDAERRGLDAVSFDDDPYRKGDQE